MLASTMLVVEKIPESCRLIPNSIRWSSAVVSVALNCSRLLLKGLKSLLEHRQMAPPRDQSGDYTVSSQNTGLENCVNTNHHLTYNCTHTPHLHTSPCFSAFQSLLPVTTSFPSSCCFLRFLAHLPTNWSGGGVGCGSLMSRLRIGFASKSRERSSQRHLCLNRFYSSSGFGGKSN